MRRLAAGLLVPISAVIALSGCGSPAPANPNASVAVSGKVGTTPTVSIPSQAPTGQLATKTVVVGKGQKLATGDTFLANFSVYKWHGKSHSLLFSTYSARPEVLAVQMGLTGLQKALVGARIGSRVLAVLPPKYAFGAAGNAQAGVGPTDTLVWVMDPIQAFGPAASATGTNVSHGGGKLPTVTSGATGLGPVISIPKGAPPTKTTAVTMIKGTGAPIKLGDSIIVKYTGMLWRDSHVFDTNWPTPASTSAIPRQFTLGQLIKGWNALAGTTVGSRVLLVIPPADGYGKAGNPQAGIKGTDTLVFVVDVLAVA